jgi:hypothetical protein
MEFIYYSPWWQLTKIDVAQQNTIYITIITILMPVYILNISLLNINLLIHIIWNINKGGYHGGFLNW